MSETIVQPKGLREVFAQFFEQPSRPALRKLLQENFGEFGHLDFKEQWPERPKLARDILGFANSTGGAMVVGVKQSGDNSLSPEGLSELTDKTDIYNAVKKFLPDGLDYTILDFSFNEAEYDAITGKMFQVLLVEDRPEYLPFISIRDGDGIKAGMAYVRHGVSTSVATHDQLQQILNRRIATGYSTDRELTLKEHLDELKALYAYIPRRTETPIRSIWSVEPEESFDAFIARMIDTKKKVIEEFLRGGRS